MRSMFFCCIACIHIDVVRKSANIVVIILNFFNRKTLPSGGFPIAWIAAILVFV
jgi:hypothetical protein